MWRRMVRAINLFYSFFCCSSSNHNKHGISVGMALKAEIINRTKMTELSLSFNVSIDSIPGKIIIRKHYKTLMLFCSYLRFFSIFWLFDTTQNQIDIWDSIQDGAINLAWLHLACWIRWALNPRSSEHYRLDRPRFYLSMWKAIAALFTNRLSLLHTS